MTTDRIDEAIQACKITNNQVREELLKLWKQDKEDRPEEVKGQMELTLKETKSTIQYH